MLSLISTRRTRCFTPLFHFLLRTASLRGKVRPPRNRGVPLMRGKRGSTRAARSTVKERPALSLTLPPPPPPLPLLQPELPRFPTAAPLVCSCTQPSPVHRVQRGRARRRSGRDGRDRGERRRRRLCPVALFFVSSCRRCSSSPRPLFPRQQPATLCAASPRPLGDRAARQPREAQAGRAPTRSWLAVLRPKSPREAKAEKDEEEGRRRLLRRRAFSSPLPFRQSSSLARAPPKTTESKPRAVREGLALP